MHMVTQCDGYTAVRQHHPHLFDELGGWQQVTRQLVSSQQFRQFMHQDPVKVASFCLNAPNAGGRTHLLSHVVGAKETVPLGADEPLFADCAG